jgi:GDP-4-dehydro-6-deoxy-D-mannose reductase
MLTYQYFVNDAIRGVRARIFNSTGPRKTNDVVSDFCSRSADTVMADGPLRVGNLETLRAILDVADLVQALLLLSDRGRPAEAYNIYADRAYRVGDIVGIIEGLAGRKLRLVSDPALFRPTDEPIIFGDTTKLKQETGWAPTLTLAEAVERVFLYELRRRSGAATRLGSNL